MKKVCILTTVHPRDDTRVLSREARSLAREYETVLLVADGQPDEDYHGVHIRSVVPEKPRSRPDRIFRVTRIMYERALAEDAAVYHFHDAELIPVGLRLKRHGRTVVYDVHESISDTITDRDYLPMWVLKLLSRVLGWYDRRCARKVDAVVTVTPFLKDRYDRLGCRTALVRNFPTLEDFPPPAEDGREESLCCAGARIDFTRCIYEMIEASQRSGLPLHVFGRIPAGLEPELRRRDEAGLLHLYGYVSPEQVRQQLYRSRIGLVVEQPTGNAVHAYCVKLFEYMAAGMAVVSSDIPLWKEIVEETGCGLCVDPCDMDAICSAVLRLKNDPDLARRMGENGRRWAEKKYNWAPEEKTLLELYRELTK